MDKSAIVKTLLSLASIYDVGLRTGSRFERVVDSRPRERGRLLVLLEINVEVVDRQWLYDIAAVMLFCQELNYSLIYRAAEVKLELRVVATLHVGEVLV